MRPLRLCLENFMSHKLTDINCSQLQSILILGRRQNDPRKSIGVGKSNIFKAIEYVLFGETQVKLDKIVRHGCDKCKVIFEFEISDRIYRIIRSRVYKSGRSDLRMFQKNNDNWIDITQKTNTETEQELAKIIKISHVAFRNAILFAQIDLNGLASATPNERKIMLKEPLHISIYNKYEKKAKEKFSTTIKDVDKIKTLINGLGDPNNDLLALASQKTNIQSYLAQVKNQHIQSTKKLEEMRNIFVDLQKYSLPDINELYRNLSKIEKDKKNIHEKIKFTNSSLIASEQNLESNIQEIKKSKEALLKLENNHQSLISSNVRNISDIKNDITKMTNKEIDGKAYISRLEMDKVKFSHTVPDGDVCKYCNQLISREHREVCENKRKEELTKVLSDLDKYKPILETVKRKRLEYENELNQLNLRENNINSINNKIISKKKEIEQNDKFIKQLTQNIELLQLELKNNIEKESFLISEEKVVKNQIEKCKNDNLLTKIEEVKKELLSLELEVKNLDKSNSSNCVNLGIIEEKISAKEKDKNKLITLQEELALKEKELSIRLKAQQAFSSSGIPTMIINTILDDLQIISNELIAKILPEVEIVFLIAKTKNNGQQEDTFDIIYRINGIEHEYDQLSGGQKFIVALCFKRALSLIIQHRIGIDIKFLLLDEVDSQFDGSTLEIFVNLIKKWQEEITIFVISHREETKNKFTHAILVEGDEVNGAIGTIVDSW